MSKKNDQTCDDCLIQLCTYIIPNVSNNVQIPKSMSFIKLTVHFIWLSFAIASVETLGAHSIGKLCSPISCGFLTFPQNSVNSYHNRPAVSVLNNTQPAAACMNPTVWKRQRACKNNTALCLKAAFVDADMAQMIHERVRKENLQLD